MLFVHGGSGRAGNKNLYAALGEAFAERGIGAVICNYRLSPKVKHPAHVEDVAKAFAWTAANIGEVRRRPEGSAVPVRPLGRRAPRLAARHRPELPEGREATPADIKGVVGVSGVYEITAGGAAVPAAFGKDEKVCRQASPLTHVTGKHPPFLIAYADNDFPTPRHDGDGHARGAEEGRRPVELVVCKDRNHYTIIIQFVNTTDPLNKAFRDFVQKNSKSGRASPPHGILRRLE